MKFTDPLLNGSFTKRVNRFLASTHINGREQLAHILSSGRMAEFLTPGRPIMLRERGSQRRKTPYDLSLVNYYGRWVSIDARLPGALLAESIENRELPEFAEYCLLKREVTYRSSRIDLLWAGGRIDAWSKPNPSPWSMGKWPYSLMPLL